VVEVAVTEHDRLEVVEAHSEPVGVDEHSCRREPGVEQQRAGVSEPLDRDQRGESVLGDEADEALALLEVRRRLDTDAEGSTARALIPAQQSVVDVVDENRDLDLVDRFKMNGVHRGPEGGTRRSTGRFGGGTCSKTHTISFLPIVRLVRHRRAAHDY
jgi:hypothetical protein